MTQEDMGASLIGGGFDPSRVNQSDRRWCTRFDRSAGFLEGKWDASSVVMKPVVEHRLEIERDTAMRIFNEIEQDVEIDTDICVKIYAAIKRAAHAPAQPPSGHHP